MELPKAGNWIMADFLWVEGPDRYKYCRIYSVQRNEAAAYAAHHAGAEGAPVGPLSA